MDQQRFKIANTGKKCLGLTLKHSWNGKNGNMTQGTPSKVKQSLDMDSESKVNVWIQLKMVLPQTSLDNQRSSSKTSSS